MVRSQTSLCVPTSLTKKILSRTNPSLSYKDVVPFYMGEGTHSQPYCIVVLVAFSIFDFSHGCSCVCYVPFEVFDVDVMSFVFVPVLCTFTHLTTCVSCIYDGLILGIFFMHLSLFTRSHILIVYAFDKCVLFMCYSC